MEETKKCDGNCNGDESPCKREPVRRVRVDGWGLFDYCPEAIAEDQRRELKLFEETGEEILNTTT